MARLQFFRLCRFYDSSDYLDFCSPTVTIIRLFRLHQFIFSDSSSYGPRIICALANTAHRNGHNAKDHSNFRFSVVQKAVEPERTKLNAKDYYNTRWLLVLKGLFMNWKHYSSLTFKFTRVVISVYCMFPWQRKNCKAIVLMDRGSCAFRETMHSDYLTSLRTVAPNKTTQWMGLFVLAFSLNTRHY